MVKLVVALTVEFPGSVDEELLSGDRTRRMTVTVRDGDQVLLEAPLMSFPLMRLEELGISLANSLRLTPWGLTKGLAKMPPKESSR